MENAVLYRRLELSECERLSEIDASQYIGKAWRIVNGARQLIDINYHDKDFPEGYDNHLLRLKNTVINQGIAIGAFNDCGRLIGFCSVNSEIFGNKSKYVLLDQLFVSLSYRGKGIGKQLFLRSAAESKRLGADKFYICAGSAEETIAFYFSIGCIEAKEINQKLYEADTRDYQLEFDFTTL